MVGSAETLLTDIFSGKTLDDSEVSKALLFLIFNLRSKIESFKTNYDNKFSSLEKRIQVLESRNAKLEMNVIARDLIFRKVPLHEDATDNVEIP